jgi:hypothetical protein
MDAKTYIQNRATDHGLRVVIIGTGEVFVSGENGKFTFEGDGQVHFASTNWDYYFPLSSVVLYGVRSSGGNQLNVVLRAGVSPG